MPPTVARTLSGLALLVAGAAHAQDVAPGANREGVVHVNAIRNPEMHAYRAIAAGLDAFDDQHALAPSVPQLSFVVRARGSDPLTGDLPTAKLSADAFSLPLPVGADASFVVPRSRQAWDADAELILGRKRKEVMIRPRIRTPGLADNQRRLGDLRLECQVLVAIAKKEAPFWVVAAGNTVLMTGDWCTFFKDKDRAWDLHVDAPLASAVLRDGERTLALPVKGRRVELPLYDASWSNDAVVDLAFAAPGPTAARTEGVAP